jgi:predicted NBD/HSP70 family sugar kinase
MGLAVSGDVDPADGLVRLSPLLGWENVDLAGPVGDATGLAVVVQNDVKALTIAEHWFGDGVGTDDFTLITVGAGIGCGIVTGGRLLSGAYGVAGEIGHICVDASGPVCHCGARGCVEAIAATEAIVGRARRLTGRDGLTFTEAAELARSGADEIRALFSEAGTAIGLGITAVVNLIGPERIVVSGENLDAYDLFETEIREAYATHAFGAAARCPSKSGRGVPRQSASRPCSHRLADNPHQHRTRTTAHHSTPPRGPAREQVITYTLIRSFRRTSCPVDHATRPYPVTAQGWSPTAAPCCAPRSAAPGYC